MWNFGPHNSTYFLKDQTRQMLLREAILSFFGANEKEETTSVYCQSCKQANPNVDCSKCNKSIEVVKRDGKRDRKD